VQKRQSVTDLFEMLKTLPKFGGTHGAGMENAAPLPVENPYADGYVPTVKHLLIFDF
jgi:hypothetical protein